MWYTTVSFLNILCNKFRQEKPKEAIHQAKQEITRVKMTYEILLGDINEHTRELKKFADDWTSKLDFANQIAKYFTTLISEYS